MTAEEFLEWAEARPEKHWELFEGVPTLQQSQTWGHADVKGRFYVSLLNAVESSGLALFVGIDGLVVKAAPKTAFEPDVVVFAGTMARDDVVAPSPMIVVEVLSRATARKDLTVKLAGYFNVPTIQHYLIADWERREIVHYRRDRAGIAPTAMVNEGLLQLDPPGISIALADVFK